MEHECEANSCGARVFFDSGGWYIGGETWEDQYAIDICPYCGVKLERSLAEAPVPLGEDDELKRLREADKRWHDQKKNMQREIDRLYKQSAELTRLWAIEKALLSDAGGWISSHEHAAGYFRHLATQIQEQYPGAADHLRRIADILEPEPLRPNKLRVSRKVLRRWRGIIASDVCYRGMTADGIRKVQAEMGLLLND